MLKFKWARGSASKTVLGLRFIVSGVVLCASLFAVFMIMLAFKSRFTEALAQNTLRNNVQVGTQLATGIEDYFVEILSVAETMNAVMDESPQGLMQAILFTTRLRSDIEAIAVLDRFGVPVPADPSLALKPDVNIFQQDWCNLNNLHQYGYDISMPHVQNLFRGQYEWVVSLVYLSRWTDENGVVQVGGILVDINFDAFNDMCAKAAPGDEGFVYITDRYGNIVYHPSQHLLYLGLKAENTAYYVGTPDGSGFSYQDGKRFAYSVNTLPLTGWRVVSIDYLKSVFTFDTNMQHDLIAIISVILLLSLAIAMISSYYITRSIHRLTSTVQETKNQNFDIHMDLNQYRIPNEIRELARSFDHMLGRIHGLVAEIKSEQLLLRKSELKALQAQINPHFLYNTLDSIVWLAESQDHKGVTVMTTSLADLFRLSISSDQEFISVADELKHAQSYLIIQKIRYQDKFDYELIVEPGAMECMVTRILLQPLIENAIYHGIQRMVDKGNITVRARILGKHLLLEVEDNGCGMSGEALRGILSSIPKNGSGIGVQNVHQRIQLLFGKEYGLEYQSELEAGTTATIKLPIIHQEKNR